MHLAMIALRTYSIEVIQNNCFRRINSDAKDLVASNSSNSKTLPFILKSKSAITAKIVSHNFHVFNSTINREMYCSEVDIGNIDCSTSLGKGKLWLFPTMVEYQKSNMSFDN